jgi:hypothetical protein
MENWSLRENNDSPVGVNGFVDNMQLLWKLQSLEPLLSTDENDASQSTFPGFNQSNSTSDLPDDDDLVDKLFRESLAMQQGLFGYHGILETYINNSYIYIYIYYMLHLQISQIMKMKIPHLVII